MTDEREEAYSRGVQFAEDRMAEMTPTQRKMCEANTSSRDPRITQAAAQLEDLSVELKQLIIDLREGKPDPYARVYYFRHSVGQVVARLGVGTPRTRKDAL